MTKSLRSEQFWFLKKLDVVKEPSAANVLKYVAERFSIPRYTRDTGTVIWHYTDANGLLGILRTRKFWATHINHLNDKSEGRFFVDKLGKSISEKIISNKEQYDKEFANNFLFQMMRHGLRYNEFEEYVVCFCSDGDLLSQWRGYGDVGAGYALGFAADKLIENFDTNNLINIEYDQNKIDMISSEIVDIYYKNFSLKASRQYDENDIRKISENFEVIVYILRSFFKNPKYNEEKEIRLLAPRNRTQGNELSRFVKSDVLFRTRENNILPYVEVDILGKNFPDLNCFPLVEIIVGPGVEDMSAASKLLESLGMSDVILRKSEIPFRS